MSKNLTLRVIELPHPGYVYLVNAVGTNNFKIGKSGISVLNRIRQLQTGSPLEIRYVYHAFVDDMNRTERELHTVFNAFRNVGEWFTFSEANVKECITLMRLVQIEDKSYKGQEKDEEDISSLPLIVTSRQDSNDVEQEGLTSLKLTRDQALNLIKRLRGELNQTQIIERLWECKKGGSEAWKKAYAQFKELTKEEDNENQ